MQIYFLVICKKSQNLKSLGVGGWEEIKGLEMTEVIIIIFYFGNFFIVKLFSKRSKVLIYKLTLSINYIKNYIKNS